MQRRIRRLGKLLIGCHSKEHVRVMKAEIIEDTGMIERAFDHRVGARLAIFLKQVLFQRAAIHADADRAAIVARGADHVFDPLWGSDIAGIDPQTRRPGLCGFNPAFIMEVDVGHERHGCAFGNRGEGCG